MKKHLPFLLQVIVMTFVGVGLSHAGTGGTEFAEIYDTILGWTQGTLGKVIAVGMFLTGMGMGVARQSIMPVVLGIGSSLALYYTPNIVDNIVVGLI